MLHDRNTTRHIPKIACVILQLTIYKLEKPNVFANIQGTYIEIMANTLPVIATSKSNGPAWGKSPGFAKAFEI